MKYTLKKSSKKLLYLLACALNEQAPVIQSISEADEKKIFSLAHMHGVASMAYSAIRGNDSLKNHFSESTLEKFKKASDSAFKKRALLDMERDIIFLNLEQMGIWYCPLKGIIIQDLYPEYGMREMADNDILFDEGKRDELRKLLTSRGYSLDFEGVTNHDEYVKEPVYNYEFHTRLFMHTFSTVFTDYYDDIKNRLIKDEGNKYGFHFGDEDFYIYFTAHAYKHYKEGGTGFKTLTDYFVLNKSYGDTLDRKYINTELDKLGIRDFENDMRLLSEKLFKEPAKTFETISLLSEKEKELLSFISRSGAYGTDEERVREKVSRVTGRKDQPLNTADKINYYFSRVFPDMNYYREAYPFLYKHKGLIPFFVVYRMVYRPVVNRKKLAEELRTVLRM